MVGILVGGKRPILVVLFFLGRGREGCAGWLISLQWCKNVVIGSWDSAKPILAGGGPVGDGR